MNVVVITVTHNSERHILRWAAALSVAWCCRERDRRGTLRAVVVDNDSTDSTVETLRRDAPWVEVLALRRNVGFAAGCNFGIARAPADAVVIFLNPDVQVRRDFFTTLQGIRWSSRLAAVGPRVIGTHGELEQSARRFPSAWTGLAGRQALVTKLLPSLGVVRRELLASVEPGARVVDWVSGACMVTTRNVLAGVGGMDERYFMYWEDADWCRRAARAGFEVRYEPALVVRHDQGASARSHPFRTIWHFHRSALRYYRRHVSRWPLETALACVALTMRGTWKAALALPRLLRTPR